MTGFLASFRAELSDLARHPLVWISIIAVGGAAGVAGVHEPIRENGWIVYQAGLLAGARTAAFFLLALAAVAVSADRTRGTVRWILPRPVARGGWVLGKASAHALLALLLLVVAVSVAFLAASDLGFGDVTAEIEGDEDDAVFNYIEEESIEPEFRAATMQRRTLAATLLVLPALLTACGLGLLVSSLLASSAGAVIVAIAVALPLAYLPEVIGLGPAGARSLPFRAATDFLEQVREFGRHFNTAEWPAYGTGALVGALVGSLGLPALAAWIFTRVELTD